MAGGRQCTDGRIEVIIMLSQRLDVVEVVPGAELGTIMFKKRRIQDQIRASIPEGDQDQEIIKVKICTRPRVSPFSVLRPGLSSIYFQSTSEQLLSVNNNHYFVITAYLSLIVYQLSTLFLTYIMYY